MSNKVFQLLLPMSMQNFTSYRYRLFKRQFSELSHLHWIFSYAIRLSDEHLRELWANGTGDILLHDLRPIPDITSQRLSLKASEFQRRQPEYLEKLRLLLLVKACAALEDYLHCYLYYYAIFLGHGGSKPNNLSDVGNALIKPGLASNLSNCLNYMDQLMGLGLNDEQRDHIHNAYKTRCAVAHNGGIVDRETKKSAKIFQNLPMHAPIPLSWDDLNEYLIVISDIALLVEQRISPLSLLGHIECLWLVADALIDEHTEIENIKKKKTLTSEKRKREIGLAKKMREMLRNEYAYSRYVPKEDVIRDVIRNAYTVMRPT